MSKEVEQISENFVKVWNKYLSINPVLLLDYSWPSISVVDLLTFSCRYKKDLSKILDDILIGASAYIGVVAKNCFKDSFDEVTLDNSEFGIILKLEKNSDLTLIEVETLFRKRIEELPNPFPVVEGFETPITFEAPVVSFFCIGLFTAQMPDVDWSNVEGFRSDIITNTKKHLANTCEQYLSKLVKKHSFAHLAEFYLNDLIYPPMMMNETLPLLNSIDKVISYFEEFQISKKVALEIGNYLVLSPDYLLSNLGLILVCALSNKVPSQRVIAAAQRKGDYVVFLRRAVKKVREFYGIESDWIKDGLKNEEMIEQYLVEKSMKFLPWLTLSIDRLEEDKEKNALAYAISRISEYDFEGALEFCDKVLDEQPEDTELLIQKIYLKLQLGKLAEVDELLPSLMTAPNVEEILSYFNLLAKISMAKKDFERAYNYFKAGLNIKSKDLMLLTDMQNDAAWCCMLLGKRGQALIHLEQGLLTSNCPVTILLNKSSILWELGDFERALKIREDLFQVSPYDRRVFSNLTLESPVET